MTNTIQDVSPPATKAGLTVQPIEQLTGIGRGTVQRVKQVVEKNRPNGIKIREQCPKKSRIKMQEVGEGKLKTGKPPKKSIANKPAGKQ